jgi:hypothetical protein
MTLSIIITIIIVLFNISIKKNLNDLIYLNEDEKVNL